MLRNTRLARRLLGFRRLLRLGLEVPVQAVGNIYVGIRLRGGDREEARESLGVPPYPALPYLGPGPASAGPR